MTTLEETRVRVAKLSMDVTPFIRDMAARPLVLRREIEPGVSLLYDLENMQVQRYKTDALKGINVLYDSSMYNLLKAYDFGSPSIIGVILGVWSVLKDIYNTIKWVVEILHIKEIIQIVEFVRYVSPQFRQWTDQLMQGVKELAKEIGIGADGFYHLLHATQGVLSATGGMLGKEWDWLEGKYAEKTMAFAQNVNQWSEQIRKDPAAFLDQYFITEKSGELKDLNENWQKVWKGIENGLEWGEKALENTKELTESLQTLEQSLPGLVRDAIPQNLWDAVHATDQLLEDEIIPRFQEMNSQVSALSQALTTQQNKMGNLARRLALPGSYLKEIEGLDAQLAALQYSNVDDVSGNQYNRETDDYDARDQGIIDDMRRIEEAGIPPGPAPTFMGLETAGIGKTVIRGGKEYTSWFVGDF